MVQFQDFVKNYLLSFFLFVVFLNGCASNIVDPGEPLAQVQSDDPSWVAQFKNTLGKSWYKIKRFDVLVGRAGKERRIVLKDGNAVYQILHEEKMLLQILGTSNRIEATEIKTFSASPPYLLLSYDRVEMFGKKERRLHIDQKKAGTYEVSFSFNGKRGSETFFTRPYSLEEELKLEMWSASVTKINEYIFFPQFFEMADPSQKIRSYKATVQNIRLENVDGKKYNVARIGVEHKDNRMTYLEFDNSGRLRSMTLEGALYYYFQEKKPEFPTGEVDLYVHNMVPISQKIGSPKRIKRLHLSIEGENVDLLKSGPTQKVLSVEDGKKVSLVIDTDKDNESVNEVSPGDSSDLSRTNFRVILDDTEIGRLAKEAVGDAVFSGEIVDKLVKFVDDYLSNEYVFDSDLQELIKGKKGDCSEHAMLFCALARSAGILCRDATGLVYMGDWCQGFALHAWNEVYLKGHWQAVDASRSRSRIFPVYIRFPDDQFEALQIMNAVHKMKIHIDKVELIGEDSK